MMKITFTLDELLTFRELVTGFVTERLMDRLDAQIAFLTARREDELAEKAKRRTEALDEKAKLLGIKVAEEVLEEVEGIRATLENYEVTMNTRIRPENYMGDVPRVIRHLPTFLMPAHSPQEAIIKVRALFGAELRIAGKVLHGEDEMDFDHDGGLGDDPHGGGAASLSR